VVESGVSSIAASCGTLAKVGRDSTVGDTTLATPTEPGGDGPLAPLKLGTRFLGTYVAEWRFLWRARRSARTKRCSHPEKSHRNTSFGESGTAVSSSHHVKGGARCAGHARWEHGKWNGASARFSSNDLLAVRRAYERFWKKVTMSREVFCARIQLVAAGKAARETSRSPLSAGALVSAGRGGRRDGVAILMRLWGRHGSGRKLGKRELMVPRSGE